MVLQYVMKHGRITRREVAELCRMESQQAKRLLGRLVTERKLKRLGVQRGIWYE